MLIRLPFLPRLFFFVYDFYLCYENDQSLCSANFKRKRQKFCTMPTFSNLLMSNKRQYKCTVFWYELSKIIFGHNMYFLLETHTLFIIFITAWHLHRNPIPLLLPGIIQILWVLKNSFRFSGKFEFGMSNIPCFSKP